MGDGDVIGFADGDFFFQHELKEREWLSCEWTQTISCSHEKTVWHKVLPHGQCWQHVQKATLGSLSVVQNCFSVCGSFRVPSTLLIGGVRSRVRITDRMTSLVPRHPSVNPMGDLPDHRFDVTTSEQFQFHFATNPDTPPPTFPPF